MNLTIKERIFLRLTFKPPNVGLISYDMWKSIEEKVMFTPEEIENYRIVDVPGNIEWNTRIDDPGRDFEFTDSQKNFLKRHVQELDRTEKIPNYDDVVEFARKILML